VATRNRGSVPMSHRPLSFVKTNPAAGATVVELWSGSIRKSLALYTGAQRDCMIPVLTKMPDPWHSKLRSCYVWLLPLLAFAALGLLLVFGGEHWLYQLPSFQTPSADTQLFWGRSDALRGAVELPTVVQSGTPLALAGWLEAAPARDGSSAAK